MMLTGLEVFLNVMAVITVCHISIAYSYATRLLRKRGYQRSFSKASFRRPPDRDEARHIEQRVGKPLRKWEVGREQNMLPDCRERRCGWIWASECTERVVSFRGAWKVRASQKIADEDTRIQIVRSSFSVLRLLLCSALVDFISLHCLMESRSISTPEHLRMNTLRSNSSPSEHVSSTASPHRSTPPKN